MPADRHTATALDAPEERRRRAPLVTWPGRVATRNGGGDLAVHQNGWAGFNREHRERKHREAMVFEPH